MVIRKGAIAGCVAVGVSMVACGAPELTYRDGELAGLDAGADADGSIDPDVAVDQQADVQDAKPEAHEAAIDVASESHEDAVDAPMDQQSEPTADVIDAAPDAPEDTTTDPIAEPFDALEDQKDAPLDVPEEQQDAAWSCPVGMVAVPKATTGSYCIDATEVRQAAYATWLATSPATGGQPAECSGNATFAPATAGACASAYHPGATPNLPVVCIDWCDAVAYCTAQGKRLCGNVGGGAMAFGAFTDASFDQWHRACSLGGAKSYPYGASYAAGTCTDSTTATADVGSKQGCEGGLSGVFDMSGNVSEWEYACNGTNPNSRCRLRGGSYLDTGAAVACGADADQKRMTQNTTTGLRCCSLL